MAKETTVARTTDNYSVSIRRATKAVESAFRIKRPVFLWGPAGIGKSDAIRQIAAKFNAKVIDFRLGQIALEDLKGLPIPDTSNPNNIVTRYARPEEFPSNEEAAQYPMIILFLDEMNQAAPSIQAAAYQLMLDRAIGSYRLPDNVVIVAAGNRASDRGVTYQMPEPLATRILHLELRVDFDDWFEWAATSEIHPDVMGFLNFDKAALCPMPTVDKTGRINSQISSGYTKVTPRGWAFVSQILRDDESDEDTKYDLVVGALGEGMAIQFFTHRKYLGKLPNPVDILLGKVQKLKLKDDDIAASYSITLAMCQELKHMRDDTELSEENFHERMNNFLKFMMDNFEAECVVLGIKMALKNYKIRFQHALLPCWSQFHDRYGKLILESLSTTK